CRKRDYLENFLELEEFLELKDGEQLEDLYSRMESCVVELEPTEERMHKSESSHLSVLKHQRPLIWAEEVARIHKRVKRINDPVKFVVSCAMVEVEFPILPDRSVN
ncbi:hypothetical protein HID58_087185, partial [Brassica napus]